MEPFLIRSLLALSLWSVVTVGVPSAFASIIVIPKPSRVEGETKSFADFIRDKTWLKFFRWPRNFIFFSRFNSFERLFRVFNSGPMPAMIT